MIPEIKNWPYRVFLNAMAKADPDMKTEARQAVVDAFLETSIPTAANEKSIEDLKQFAEGQREKGDFYEGKDFRQLWKEKRYGAAIGEIFLQGAESVPTSIAAIIPGGLAMIGAGSAAEKYRELDKIKKPSTTADDEEWEDYLNKANMSEIAKLSNAILSGSAEALSEYIGRIPFLRWGKNYIAKQGVKATQQTIKKGVLPYILNFFDKYGLYTEPIVEGAEEFVNQLAQNTTDYLT
jgi:hypothetical protein